jgi:hypothetical protein
MNGASVQSYQQVVVHDLLEGVPVARLKRSDVPTDPPDEAQPPRDRHGLLLVGADRDHAGDELLEQRRITVVRELEHGRGPKGRDGCVQPRLHFVDVERSLRHGDDDRTGRRARQWRRPGNALPKSWYNRPR